MLRKAAKRDRAIGLFIAGVVLFDPPILNLPGGRLFGWPALYLYLFAVWALLIAGMAVLMEKEPPPPAGRGTDQGR